MESTCTHILTGYGTFFFETLQPFQLYCLLRMILELLETSAAFNVIYISRSSDSNTDMEQ